MDNTRKKRKRKRHRGRRILLAVCICAVFLLAAIIILSVWLRHDKKTVAPEPKQEQIENAMSGEEELWTDPAEKMTAEGKTTEIPGKESRTEDGGLSAIWDYINKMSLEDKVAQMFVVTPEALTHMDLVTEAGELTREAINANPIGGLVYFNNNVLSEEQFAGMIQNVQMYSMDRTGLPLLICMDEEGGNVARITGRGLEGVPDIPDMYSIGAAGDTAAAYETGSQMGAYLSRFGINVDFAPVADLYTNENNTVIGTRAFGSDPGLAASMVKSVMLGLQKQNVSATLKHFPGHGSTEEDSHYGGAYCYKSLEELRNKELIPFQTGIDSGAGLVMVGHISLPNILGDNTPASLSGIMITDVLRNEMGFQGIVITDSLSMGAIENVYSPAEAAVCAVQAGVDILLMPSDFAAAYQGLMEAVWQGEIEEARINQSLERIFRLKMNLSVSGTE